MYLLTLFIISILHESVGGEPLATFTDFEASSVSFLSAGHKKSLEDETKSWIDGSEEKKEQIFNLLGSYLTSKL